MHFGGLQKNSFIDYPKNISCVLFAAGCNFHCPYCHNPDLITPAKSTLFHSDILDFLKTRHGLLDAVVISGGEPTLQSDLYELCEQIKSMGFLVKLDTNGSRPESLRQLLANGLVDYMAMDIKTSPESYVPAIAQSIAPETLLESIFLIMGSGAEYEFRTTCVRPFIDAAVLTRIAALVKGARRYALQQFRPHKILNPGFISAHGPHYDADDLAAFKKIMAQQVDECIIR